MPTLQDLKANLSETEFCSLLEAVHNEVLDRNRKDLCMYIRVEDHFPMLRQKKIFVLDIEEMIKCQQTTQDKNHRFIDELQRNGGVEAFPSFVQSLHSNRTQEHVVRKLNKCFESISHDVPPEIYLKYWDGQSQQQNDGIQQEMEAEEIVEILDSNDAPPFDLEMFRLTQIRDQEGEENEEADSSDITEDASFQEPANEGDQT